jgi:hypothetical protein
MWGLLTRYTYYADEADARKLDQFRKRLVTGEGASAEPEETNAEASEVSVAS